MLSPTIKHLRVIFKRSFQTGLNESELFSHNRQLTSIGIVSFSHVLVVIMFELFVFCTSKEGSCCFPNQKIRDFVKRNSVKRLKGGGGCLNSALYPSLKNRNFEICVGRFHEKLLFSDLRLLFTKTQYSSDITSKVRINRLTPDITRTREASMESKRDPLKTTKILKKYHSAEKN